MIRAALSTPGGLRLVLAYLLVLAIGVGAVAANRHFMEAWLVDARAGMVNAAHYDIPGLPADCAPRAEEPDPIVLYRVTETGLAFRCGGGTGLFRWWPFFDDWQVATQDLPPSLQALRTQTTQ